MLHNGFGGKLELHVHIVINYTKVIFTIISEKLIRNMLEKMRVYRLELFNAYLLKTNFVYEIQTRFLPI